MSLLFRMAWRNLMRHRGKSLVIGSILCLGTLIMTVGNAVISGLDSGLALHFRQQLCGDLVIISSNQLKENVFFIPMGEAVESIDQLGAVIDTVTQNANVAITLPVAKGIVFILNDDGDPYYQMLFGVNFTDYFKAFPDSVSVIEGALPTNNQRGVLLSTTSREDLLKFSNVWSIPYGNSMVTANLPEGITPNTVIQKNRLIYMGFSDRDTSLDIIATVNAVITYSAFNQLWGLFSLIDIDSYNECNGFYASPAPVRVAESDQILLNSTNLDDMVFGGAAPQVDRPSRPTMDAATQHANFTTGYNIVLVKLNNPNTLDQTVDQLNSAFKTNQLPAKAITWKAALGQVAQMALLMRGILFGFVVIVFIVAIIVITNTLSLAAMERVTEIGMMRAIGAKRGLISLMFITETSVLSLVFGGAGIIAGLGTVLVLRHLHIHTTNRLVELFYGGPTFNPIITLNDLGLGLLQLVIVTIISVVYPIIIARRITPMDAISRE